MHLLIAGITFVALLVGLVFYNAWVTAKWHQQHAGSEISEEAGHYYGNFFYVNPEDPRILKPRGGGYTINFGQWPAVMVMVVAIGFITFELTQ
jgi:uncharacterized membrane protein